MGAEYTSGLFSSRIITLLSSLLKVNSARIFSQYQIFYQRLEIKLIHLLQFLIFLEISWGWLEFLKVTDWILRHYEMQVLDAIATAQELTFLPRIIIFSSK